MSYGGYWDKLGLSFEDSWALYQLVLMTGPASEIESLEREPVGEDEVGTDLWLNRHGGLRECHQCKSTKEGRARWSMVDLNREGILGHLSFQVGRDPSRHRFRLVSGTPAGDFGSLLREARDSRDADSFWLHQVQPSRRLRSAFSIFCNAAQLVPSNGSDCERARDLLRASDFILFQNDEGTKALLADSLQSRLEGSANTALELLTAWLRAQLRVRIDIDAVSAYLSRHNLHLIRGGTDRFLSVASAHVRRRARQGDFLKLDAELSTVRRLAQVQVGEQIEVLDGRWKLLQKLGSGGLAEVWLAEDQQPDNSFGQRLLAVKLLRAELAFDLPLRTRFLEGARRVFPLRHPSITRVLSEPRQSDDRYFYTMEYWNSANLQHWIERMQLPSRGAGTVVHKDDRGYGDALWSVVTAVGDGLTALHRADLVHGDLTPSNILVDEGGIVKLCDFDLVHVASSEVNHRDVVGTMPFLAPETLSGGPRTPRSDQFSFAMTLVAILSGSGAIVHHADRDPVELLRSLACNIGLRKSLERALALDPIGRFPSIEDFMEGLGPEAFNRQ